MEVRYATHHKWTRPLTLDGMGLLGKSNTHRLRSTLIQIENSTVTYEFSPLTNETLEWFEPLYVKTISAKENPKLFDIKTTTIGKESKYPYYSLTIFESGKPIGATIFSERNTILSIAYRIYPNEWNENGLQAKPSLYAEYLINQYGFNGNFKILSHGRDRNPYGVNSNIGLAIFKLSIGCSAQLTTTEQTCNILNLDEVDQDILVLKYPTDRRRITNGILYVLEENLSKYLQVTKYPEQLTVEIVNRKSK